MSEEKSSNVLEPGVVIRPQMSLATAADLILKVFGLKGVDLKEFVSYDDRNFFFRVDLDSGEISNPHLSRDKICPNGYMLKVTNSLDSKDEDFFDAQNSMILHLHSKGLEVPVPLKNIHGTYKSLESLDDSKSPWIANNIAENAGATKYIVRALEFVPGKTLYEISPWTTEHFVQCGKFAAEVDLALSDFDHPGFKTRNSIWFLSSLPKLTDFTDAVKDMENRTLVLDIIATFSKEVKPIEGQLASSIIHGDLNEQNLLVRKGHDGKFEIFSMIDFGDSQFNPLVYELALCIMYMMTNCTLIHPNLAGGHVLAGYLKLRKLSELEKDILRTCVAARYAQSLTMGAYSHQQDPDNDYVLTTAKTGWKVLKEFWNCPKDDLYKDWSKIVESYSEIF